MLVEEAGQIVEQLGSLLGIAQQSLSLPLPLHDQEQAPSAAAGASRASFTPAQQRLLAVLGHDPMPFDQLLADSALSVAELNAELMALELTGHIEQHAGMVSRVGG